MTHKKLQNSNFLVAGVVRNCENFLLSDVKKIQDSLVAAKSISWLLVESDSGDQSLEVLSTLKQDIRNFDFISMGQLRTQIPIRTDRLAYCRNIYLDEIRQRQEYQKIDYVLVSDFDGMNTHLTSNSISSCWTRDDWDVCTANQIGPYYDIWTIRHSLWSPNDCFSQYRFMVSHGMKPYKAYYNSVYSRMIKIPIDNDWIEVDAAFGGLSIYKKEAIISSNYAGITEDGDEVCEHVTLSKGIKNAGFRIFLNPALINTYRSEHVNKALKNIVALFFFGQDGVTRLKKFLK